MGYVKPDAYDIFVSYASVNNLPMPKRSDSGWVDVLDNEVRKFVDQRLGKKGLCSTFTDRGLAGNLDFEQEIESALDGAAVLLLVLSTGYLSSEWCLKEVGRFWEMVQRRRHAGSPMFVIEYESVERPIFLQKVTGYQFWIQNPPKVKPSYYTIGYLREDKDQDDFDKQVWTLGHELVAELKRLRKAMASGPAARSPGNGAAVAAAPASATAATARDAAVVTIVATAAEAAGPPSEDAATVAPAGSPPAEASPAPLDPSPGDGQPTKDDLRTFVNVLSMIESESQRRALPLSAAKIGRFSPDQIAACFEQLLRLID